MPRQSPAGRRFLAVATLGFCLGCAASEPIDIDDLAKNRGTPAGADGTNVSGLAGAGGPGIAGTTGAGASGVAGSVATAGTTGAAGSQSTITSGQAGTTGNAGTGGSGGDNVSGQAGTTGSAGTTGRGGTTGFAGRGGTTGFAGTTGTAGRGGTTGSAGRGGTTGSAGSGGAVDAGTNPDGAATVTFTDIYMTILTPYCAGSSCHNPGSQGGVSFSSQSNAYNAVKSRVTPGNGTGSRFYMTVNSGSMPRGAAKLSTTNLNKIKTWIDQGALNN